MSSFRKDLSGQSYLASVGLADILNGKTFGNKDKGGGAAGVGATDVRPAAGRGFGPSSYVSSTTVSALQHAAGTLSSSSSSPSATGEGQRASSHQTRQGDGGPIIRTHRNSNNGTVGLARNKSDRDMTLDNDDDDDDDGGDHDDDDAVYRIGRDVLLSLAKATPLDVGLDRLVKQRPVVAELLADQTVWLVATIEKMRRVARVPKHARPNSVEDFDQMPTVSAPSLQQPSVVLVGCGFVGSRVADRLLETKAIYPTSLYIMTRQPDTLTKYAKAGALCGSLKPSDVANADVLVIATLPGQLSSVGRSLRGHIKSSCVVISLCAGVTVEKVCSELQHSLCVGCEVDIEGAADIATYLEERGVGSGNGGGSMAVGLNLRRRCEEQLFQCLLPPLLGGSTVKEEEKEKVVVNESGIDEEGEKNNYDGPAADDPSLTMLNNEEKRNKKASSPVVGEGLAQQHFSLSHSYQHNQLQTERVVNWLSRFAFVLASAGTALGMPFHFAAFAAWSFMVTERCRSERFLHSYKDYVCPAPSDVQRMEFCHMTRFVELAGLTSGGRYQQGGGGGENSSNSSSFHVSGGKSSTDVKNEETVPREIDNSNHDIGGNNMMMLTISSSATAEDGKMAGAARDDGRRHPSGPSALSLPEAEALVIESVREKMSAMLRSNKKK